MKKILRSGFTLIELLVVITIIGILATGAVTVYTSQIQKARDSTRTTDVKAVQAGVEQYYGDQGEYPIAAAFSGVTVYVQIPSDPKTGQFALTPFDYLYNVSADANTIPNQEYEISTTYEQTANRTTKAIDTSDGGDDPIRLELGVRPNNSAHRTNVGGAITTGSRFGCVDGTSGGAATATCSATNPMLIRK